MHLRPCQDGHGLLGQIYNVRGFIGDDVLVWLPSKIATRAVDSSNHQAYLAST